jgi:hypothetical protein
MKRNLFLAAWIVALLFLAPSCGKKTGNTGLLVPEDAAIVVHVNNASLSSKLSWDEIRQSNWFKEISKQTTDTMAQQLLADPGVTGVDPKSDFVFFFKKQGRGNYYVLQGSLKDPAVYADYVKKITKDATQTKDGDITSVIMHEGHVLNWDKSHFVLIGDISVPDMAAMQRRGSYGSDRYKIPADSLTYFGKKVLTLKSSESLDQDSRFVSMVKDGSDIHLWLNTGAYYSDMLGPMMSMMGNMSALVDDNISATSFNFGNGKITMDAKQYYGKELSNLFAKYKADNVSAEMVGRIPSQNVVAALAINYPPEALKEILRVSGMDGLANMAMAETGYSIDEFVKANKGEVILAVSDLVSKTDSMPGPGGDVMSRSRPDAKVLFATAVNDQPSFEKLITLIWNQSKGAMNKSDEVTYKIENKWFVAGNSAEQINQFLAGGNTKAPFTEKISGHPVGLFIDVQKILQAAKTGTASKDTSALAALDASIATWQDVTGYGGEFKDKALVFHAEINMVDKNTNSLKQLNTFIDHIYKAMESQIRKHNINWTDSTSAHAAIEKVMLEEIKK